jgi:hypothetical protein
MRSAYLEALLAAKLAGYYIPEIEDVYLRREDFRVAHALALDFGH